MVYLYLGHAEASHSPVRCGPKLAPPIWNWISTPFAMDLHHVSCSAGMRKVVPHQTDLRLHPTPSSLLVYILLRPGLVPILGNDRVPVIVTKMMGAS